MSPDEVAVEQPQDRGLGNPLGEVEIVLGHGLRLGEPRLAEPPLEGSLLAGSLLDAKERGQDFQQGTPLTGRLVEHFAVALGDLR